jgi:tripartite-type tricarboxylate transporter receptor subunit TctC
VENRPGAAGNLATEAVAKSAPDGTTLLLVGTTAAINAALYAHLNFNFRQDIAPVAGLVTFPQIVLVNATFPVKSISELIAFAKRHPGTIAFSS